MQRRGPLPRHDFGLCAAVRLASIRRAGYALQAQDPRPLGLGVQSVAFLSIDLDKANLMYSGGM